MNMDYEPKPKMYICDSVISGFEHRIVKELPRRDYDSPAPTNDDIAFAVEKHYSDSEGF